MKIGRANLRDHAPARKNDLRRLEPDAVVAMNGLEAAIQSPARSAVAGEVIEMSIRVGPHSGRVHARQRVRAQLQVDAFHALDLLPRALDLRIALERGQDGVVQGVTRDAAALGGVGPGEKGAIRSQERDEEKKSEKNGKLTHEKIGRGTEKF